MTDSAAELQTEQETPSLTWTAWPAAERPGRTAGLVLIDLALAVLAAAIGGDAWWGVTAMLLLFASQNRWFLPTVFRVDARGVEAGYPLRRRALRWKDACQVVVDPRGGWMSDRPAGGRRGRGLDLYWGRDADSIRDAFGEMTRRARTGHGDLDGRGADPPEGTPP